MSAHGSTVEDRCSFSPSTVSWSPGSARRAPTVLVVEDEVVVARSIEACLEQHGYVVAGTVTTGEAAVSETTQKRPDLVLMDIRLPEAAMDGVEAAIRIRRDCDVPVVFLTARADEETLDRALVAEPYGFIVKPFSGRELRTGIEVALKRHAMIRERRKRDEWLGTTPRSIGDAVIAADHTGRVTYLSRRAESLTGWLENEAAGLPMEEVLELRDAGRGTPIRLPIEDVVESGEDASLGVRAVLLSRTGKRVPVADATSPIVLSPIVEQGEKLGVVAVFRDITDKHTTEAQVSELVSGLEQSNRELVRERGFLDALFEHSPYPVMVLDSSHTIRMANRSFAEVFAVSDGSRLSGTGFGNVIQCSSGRVGTQRCGSDDPCLNCGLFTRLNDVFTGETIRRERCHIDRLDGGREQRATVLVSAAPLPHHDETLAIVTLEDVTELSGLRRLLGSEARFEGIVGLHPTLQEIFTMVRDVADSPLPVMILGESGTGKELVARAMHTAGSRKQGNFVPVNCAALPDGLLESELFGHVKGAFTGATRDRKGRFELAHGGTIFLDEIGELSQAMQIKLLRVLQERTFERVGSEVTVRVDARVVCATNKDLEAEVAAGRFREDLYYRLCVIPIRVPPLRERMSDLPLLVEHILELHAATERRTRAEVSPGFLELLVAHSWPGNVRELQNVLHYSLVRSRGTRLEASHVPPSLLGLGTRATAKVGRRARIMDEKGVLQALRETAGNRSQAAKVLGVSRATLYRFLADNPAVGEKA